MSVWNRELLCSHLRKGFSEYQSYFYSKANSNLHNREPNSLLKEERNWPSLTHKEVVSWIALCDRPNYISSEEIHSVQSSTVSDVEIGRAGPSRLQNRQAETYGVGLSNIQPARLDDEFSDTQESMELSRFDSLTILSSQRTVRDC